VLLVRDGEQRLGLVVDRLVGAWQTVIRPLGKIFRQLEGVGGSTVLGTGEIAFIIDLPRLVQRAAGGTARAAA
jgi:two-component system chemotaxis sensor kinase CheA